MGSSAKGDTLREYETFQGVPQLNSPFPPALGACGFYFLAHFEPVTFSVSFYLNIFFFFVFSNLNFKKESKEDNLVELRIG
jgi:hypothetical protein